MSAPYGPEQFAQDVNVSRETLSRLETYADLLTRWQKTINLVAPSTLPDLWRRHMLDSAQMLDHAPDHARIWLDLGSGGGFPGLVLAILLTEQRPGASVRLIESDARKCAFLREVARATGAPAEIVRSRIEALPPFQADVVTARAFAPLARILVYAGPFAGPETRLLLLKGKDVDRELSEASQTWTFQARVAPSRSDPSGRIVGIDGFQRVRPAAPEPRA